MDDSDGVEGQTRPTSAAVRLVIICSVSYIIKLILCNISTRQLGGKRLLSEVLVQDTTTQSEACPMDLLLDALPSFRDKGPEHLGHRLILE